MTNVITLSFLCQVFRQAVISAVEINLILLWSRSFPQTNVSELLVEQFVHLTLQTQI